MAGGTQIPIAACREGDVLLVRPSGACTVTICGGLKDYLSPLRRPDTTDIYFDLSQAVSLDSTFIGFLVSLATRKKDPGAPAIHLVSPSAGAMEALNRMHVLSLFDVCPALPQSMNTWVVLSFGKTGMERTADLVVEAHEKLIAADPRNAPSCKPVVEGFRAEQERKKSHDA